MKQSMFALSGRSMRGVSVAGLIFMFLVLIVIPVPPLLLDAFVAVNIAVGVLLLAVTINVKRIEDLSTFPTLLLITTVFRLGVSVATARGVLAHGDAGSIVSAFGYFVVGNSVIVGLSIFLIVALVQFIVVTKGAERIAEVTARFTLDAVPGRQMAIEADARAGSISREVANARRDALRHESQIIGAMDGAMRFVKGDSIASFVIVFVNLLGGLAIGVGVRGLSLEEAGHLYSVLSVGDGLVAQIPSMLSSVAAGILVTRAGADNNDVASRIAEDLVEQRQSFLIVSAGLCLLAIVPGFPTVVCLLIAGLFAAPELLARWRMVRQPASASKMRSTASGNGERQLDMARSSDPYVCHAHPKTVAKLNADGAAELLETETKQAARTCGLAIPLVVFQDDESVEEGSLVLRVEGVHRAVVPLAGQAEISTAIRALVGHVSHAFARRLTADDVDEWLNDVQKRYPSLVAATREIPMAKLVEIVRRLMMETIPLRFARPVLEQLVQAYQNNGRSETRDYVEAARKAAAEQIIGTLTPAASLRVLTLSRTAQARLQAMSKSARTLEEWQKNRERYAQFLDHLRVFLSGNTYDLLIVDEDLRFETASVMLAEGWTMIVITSQEASRMAGLTPTILPEPETATTLIAAE
jgi:type III secretion protein V